MNPYVVVTEATLRQRKSGQINLELTIVGDPESMFKLWESLYHVMHSAGAHGTDLMVPHLTDKPQRLIE